MLKHEFKTKTLVKPHNVILFVWCDTLLFCFNNSLIFVYFLSLLWVWSCFKRTNYKLTNKRLHRLCKMLNGAIFKISCLLIGIGKSTHLVTLKFKSSRVFSKKEKSSSMYKISSIRTHWVWMTEKSSLHIIHLLNIFSHRKEVWAATYLAVYFKFI